MAAWDRFTERTGTVGDFDGRLLSTTEYLSEAGTGKDSALRDDFADQSISPAQTAPYLMSAEYQERDKPSKPFAHFPAGFIDSFLKPRRTILVVRTCHYQ